MKAKVQLTSDCLLELRYAASLSIFEGREPRRRKKSFLPVRTRIEKVSHKHNSSHRTEKGKGAIEWTHKRHASVGTRGSTSCGQVPFPLSRHSIGSFRDSLGIIKNLSCFGMFVLEPTRERKRRGGELILAQQYGKNYDPKTSHIINSHGNFSTSLFFLPLIPLTFLRCGRGSTTAPVMMLFFIPDLFLLHQR